MDAIYQGNEVRVLERNGRLARVKLTEPGEQDTRSFLVPRDELQPPRKLAEKIKPTMGGPPLIDVLMDENLSDEETKAILRRLSIAELADLKRQVRAMQEPPPPPPCPEMDNLHLTWDRVAEELHKREHAAAARGDLEPGDPRPGVRPLCGLSVRTIHDKVVGKMRHLLTAEGGAG